MQMTDLLDHFVDLLPPLTSAFLLVLVYLQYRIQRKEYEPDLDVPRVAHHLSVFEERESTRKKSDVESDEVLFEVSNLGNGSAKKVRVVSQIRALYRGDKLEPENSHPRAGGGSSPANTGESPDDLPFLQSTHAPRDLSLDVFREDVYHSNWKDDAEATVPSGKTDIGYLIHLHVKNPNGDQKSLDEVLAKDYPDKTIFRLKLILAYEGPLTTYPYKDRILDLVIYPGVCSNLQEAMEVGIPYSKYVMKDKNQATLEARVDLEEFENDTSEE